MTDHKDTLKPGRPNASAALTKSSPLQSKVERARLWRNHNLAGVELFHGEFLDYSFTRHFHPVVAFGAVESGVLRSWHRDREYTVSRGELMMFNPGDVHAPVAANAERWSFRMFYLQDEFFERLSHEVSNRTIRFSTPFASDPPLAQTLFRLHQQLEGRCEDCEFECGLLEILERLARRHSEAKHVRKLTAIPASVSRMREYIHAYADQPIRLSMLAEVGCMSMYHALRSFRDVLGLPPHKYLLQVRVERAKELLLRGATISDTAALLGFADQSHLNRHYKRIFGVAPGESLHRVP